MSFLEKHKTLLVLNFSAVVIFFALAIVRSIGVTPFDTEALTLATSINRVSLTDAMIGVSRALDPWVLSFVFLVFSLVLVYRKKYAWAFFFALSMFCAVISAVLLKDFFQIARPVDQVVPEIGWGFPSAHATAVAVFFFSLFYSIEEKIEDSAIIFLWGLVSLGLVLAVGLSRIYLEVHFASDVLAGFALGTFWVTLAILTFEVMHERKVVL